MCLKNCKKYKVIIITVALNERSFKGDDFKSMGNTGQKITEE
jgi:hypothetical protein